MPRDTKKGVPHACFSHACAGSVAEVVDRQPAGPWRERGCHGEWSGEGSAGKGQKSAVLRRHHPSIRCHCNAPCSLFTRGKPAAQQLLSRCIQYVMMQHRLLSSLPVGISCLLLPLPPSALQEYLVRVQRGPNPADTWEARDRPLSPIPVAAEALLDLEWCAVASCLCVRACVRVFTHQQPPAQCDGPSVLRRASAIIIIRCKSIQMLGVSLSEQ